MKKIDKENVLFAEFNKKCLICKNTCKQSVFAEIIKCPSFSKLENEENFAKPKRKYVRKSAKNEQIISEKPKRKYVKRKK